MKFFDQRPYSNLARYKSSVPRVIVENKYLENCRVIPSQQGLIIPRGETLDDLLRAAVQSMATIKPASITPKPVILGTAEHVSSRRSVAHSHTQISPRHPLMENPLDDDLKPCILYKNPETLKSSFIKSTLRDKTADHQNTLCAYIGRSGSLQVIMTTGPLTHRAREILLSSPEKNTGLISQGA